MNDLLTKSVEDLLEKFGKGEHKPGSGSASAFQGMLSAQLIKTVINITNEERYRENYKDSIDGLNQIIEEITDRIYPELTKLFVIDSEQFDIAIKHRRDRDNEHDPFKKNVYKQQALQALMPATETPIEIARLCVKLAEFGMFVFQYGFQAARGDSAVAFRGAIAAIAGCISIVELNLLSLDGSTWVNKIQGDLADLKFVHLNLTKQADECAERLANATAQNISLHKRLTAIISAIPPAEKLTNTELEGVARSLQNVIWDHRDVIWRKQPKDEWNILSPKRLLTLLGYHVELSNLDSYEVEGKEVAVAGVIDKQSKTVIVSNSFGKQVENFTTAHELAHALFHKQDVLHRDRALDGSTLRGERSVEERQADRFASFFLMPEKQIRKVFRKLFKKERFELDNDAMFALTFGRSVNESDFKIQLKNDPLMLSRIVANLNLTLEGEDELLSMAGIFGVSVEAMAIRLRELAIVD